MIQFYLKSVLLKFMVFPKYIKTTSLLELLCRQINFISCCIIFFTVIASTLKKNSRAHMEDFEILDGKETVDSVLISLDLIFMFTNIPLDLVIDRYRTRHGI